MPFNPFDHIDRIANKSERMERMNRWRDRWLSQKTPGQQLSAVATTAATVWSYGLFMCFTDAPRLTQVIKVVSR